MIMLLRGNGGVHHTTKASRSPHHIHSPLDFRALNEHIEPHTKRTHI